ncbi:glycosyltransferase family 2 protein [Patescibacteria group bacterium]|nr:glycosyltransferase family 2 protein [Patescibacteria group bacterium]
MKTAVIIPAHNEEKTIVNIIKAAKGCEFLDEIIVVNDGSSDKTAEVAKAQGVKVVSNPANLGKGEALERGVKATDADILLFLDADLIDFKTCHINNLLIPVLEKGFDMSVGAVDRSKISNFLNRIFQKIESPFSGMRAMQRSFWEEIPAKYKKDFYVESTITYLAKRKKLKVFPLVLEGVRHIIKEKKLGFLQGTKARWKMNFQIVFINIALRLNFKN